MYCSQTNWERSIQPMAVEVPQPLGTGSRKPGCEQPRKGDQGRLHPSPKQEQADHSRYIMQGRPEGRGSFGNGLLHIRPLPRRRMNQRPQALPTLIHCPDNTTTCQTISQTEGGGSTSHSATAEAKPPQSALHLSVDSLSDRTLPKHAAAGVRHPHGHLSPQHHIGMWLINSVGMHQPPSSH
jgi:hypothetical protein